MGANSATSSRTAALRTRLHYYATLLAAELTVILVYPFIVGSGEPQSVARLCGLIIFVAAIYGVLGMGRRTAIATALGVPALLIHAINVAGYWLGLQTFALVLGLLFLVFVTTVMIATILTDASVTTDTLAGAVSAYLLVGIMFGFAYTLIEQMAPGSFKDTIQPGKHFTQPEFTFFSFVTLTTVGYGDIVPWGPHARAAAMLESVIGIMYPAVLIGRLVGLHGRKREDAGVS